LSIQQITITILAQFPKRVTEPRIVQHVVELVELVVELVEHVVVLAMPLLPVWELTAHPG